MSFPWGRTTPGVRPKLLHMLLAVLTALLGPALLGIGLVALGGPLATVDSGLTMTIGFFMLYSPMFSWAGLLPGVFLHWLSWRAGAGGLATCLVIAAILGLFLSSVLGPLAWIFALPLAAIYWVMMRWLNPDSLRAA